MKDKGESYLDRVEEKDSKKMESDYSKEKELEIQEMQTFETKRFQYHFSIPILSNIILNWIL